MFSMRRLLFGCALVSVVGCVDQVAGPVGNTNPIGLPGTPAGPTLEAIQGVLEQVEERFGLRQPSRLVMIRYADTESLAGMVGMQVIVYGAFSDDGEFAAASVELVEEGEAETSRVSAKATSKTGGKR